MVVVKNKIKSFKQEVMFIGTYMKIYADFENKRTVVEFNNGSRLYFRFRVYDDIYPKPEIKYYETYLSSSILEFVKDHLRNLKVKILGNVKGDLAMLGCEIFDYSSRKRDIPLKIDISISYSNIEDISSTKIKYDDFRNCLVIQYKEGNENKEILIGNHGREFNVDWQYQKNISLIRDSIEEHVATLTTTLNYKNNLFEMFIADDIDSYDNAYLHFNTSSLLSDSTEDFVEVADLPLRRVYNYFYNYLSDAIFSNDLYSACRDYYVKGNNVKLRCDNSNPFVKDILGKKNVNWMDLGDENILGKSLYHTLLLANKLVDSKHYKESYTLIKNYAHSFYDILNFSMVDRLSREPKIVEQMFLFVRAFNKLFLNLYYRGKTLYHEFYVPHELGYLDVRDYSYRGLLIDSINITNHSNRVNYSLEFLNNKRLNKLVIVKITDESVEKKVEKIKNSVVSLSVFI